MKRICFLTDSIFSYGGVQRVTAVIAKELAKEYDVTIVTMDSPESMDKHMYELGSANLSFRFLKWPTYESKVAHLSKLYSALYRKVLPKTDCTSHLYGYSCFTPAKRKTLIEELNDGNYDVIIGVHAPLAARLATIKHHLGKAKVIGWIHNSFEALYSKGSTYIGNELKHHYVYQLKRLDDVVVLCNHDAEKYCDYDKEIRPTVIYNPLTLVPGEMSKGNSKKFLAVGRFSRLHKGFDLLIKAFCIFAKNNKEWTLDIVGEGVEEDMYNKLIAEHNMHDRITIHPFTDNVQLYYSDAQIYVLSSRWEGFGLVLVEAMAHGLPIVSSDIPTSKEIMGDFGIYFKNGDIEELAKALEESTRIAWQQSSEQAIHIANSFDIRNIIGKWKNIIGA